MRAAFRLPGVWVAGGALFIVLATANGAGYRYGTSDQALYIPAVVRALDASAFPRDASMIDAQGRLMFVDDLLAGAVRVTGLPLDVLFLGGYLASLTLTWTGLILIGTRVYRNPWAIAALAAALTLRHRIPRTSANSFEPYFHPRMLAFALGALAVAAVLRRRAWTAIGLVAVSAAIHPTTALWFAILLGVALAILDVRMRRLAVAGAMGAAAVLVWAVAVGPLQGALVVMDDPWLQAVANKDSLFATGWPLWAWSANFGVLGLLWWAHRVRTRRGDATPEDTALAWAATALVGLFVITLPAVAAGLSLVVQFQIPRVFWLVDFLATVYVVAAVADARVAEARAAPAPDTRARRVWAPPLPAVAAIVLIACSAGRGAYIMLVERPDRALFAATIQESPWENAMQWVAEQPSDVHLLADPGHAWKYGTSARVSTARDVLLEEVKDTALAIYSRDVALRFLDRTTALGDFSALTDERARALAHRYDLDFLVTENGAPSAFLQQLPIVYRNERFRIYDLR